LGAAGTRSSHCSACEEEEEDDGRVRRPLIDCAEPRTDPGIGTVQARGEMSHKKGSDNATERCGEEFESDHGQQAGDRRRPERYSRPGEV
jgi:hypothetical protein